MLWKDPQFLIENHDERLFLFRFWCKEDLLQDVDSMLDIIESL